jgi:cytochrome c biogenesis protein CcmG, thiol:disulfide interchange protein DsbE
MRAWPKRLLWVLLVAAAAAGLGVGLSRSGSATSGRPAPGLPRELLAGPAPARRGSPELVVFWASWCGPCAQEAPALEDFAQSAAGRGHVIGVNSSDGPSEARSFIRRHGWTFTNLRDASGAVGSAYGVSGLPTSFVLDASGRIRAELHGPQDEQALARALAQAS